MRVIAPIPKQFEDSNGVPYANGKVTVYLHNSTSLARIYKEAEGGTLAPNPTILDSHGAWNAFVNGGTAYDYVVQDEHDNVIFSYSNVKAYAGGGGGGGGGMAPSILIAQKWGTHYVSGTDAGTDPLTNGIFLFQEKEKLGEDIWVDESNHKIYCKKGWYHFDFQVFFFVNKIPYSYNGGTQPRIDSVQVNAGGSGDSLRVDLDRGTTDTYTTTAQFGADIYASFDGFNISATIEGLGYNSYAHVGLMAIHKIVEDE